VKQREVTSQEAKPSMKKEGWGVPQEDRAFHLMSLLTRAFAEQAARANGLICPASLGLRFFNDEFRDYRLQ
jgi:hypothetical protein